MPRILGVNIPEEKRMEIALTYVKGIGLFSSRNILKNANIDLSMRARDITSENISTIQKIIEKEDKIEGELRRTIMMKKIIQPFFFSK